MFGDVLVIMQKDEPVYPNYLMHLFHNPNQRLNLKTICLELLPWKRVVQLEEEGLLKLSHSNCPIETGPEQKNWPSYLKKDQSVPFVRSQFKMVSFNGPLFSLTVKYILPLFCEFIYDWSFQNEIFNWIFHESWTTNHGLWLSWSIVLGFGPYRLKSH